MNEKLLLVGAGGFGRVVLEHAIQTYDCSFIDDGSDVGMYVNGTPIIGRTSELEQLFAEYKELIITIGNNQLREKLYKIASDIGYSFPNIIAPSAYISPYASIGTGCVILNNAVIQNNAKIGNGCILNPGVEAHHDSSIGNYCLIYTNSVVRSLTNVGDRALIGSTVTVSTYAHVSNDAIIEDGSIVKKNEYNGVSL